MDFKRIQYIFIIAFFILDLFLVNGFMTDSRHLFVDAQVGKQRALDHQDISSIAQIPLDDETRAQPFVVGEHDGEVLKANIEHIKGQNAAIDAKGRVLSQLHSPLTLPSFNLNDSHTQLPEDVLQTLIQFLKSDAIIQGERYRFGHYNPQQKTITFFEVLYDQLPLVDSSGELIFHLNEAGDVISYEQTLVDGQKAQGDPRTLISEKQAVENLLLNNELPAKSVVTGITLAYRSTLILDGFTMYKPVWLVTVKRHNDDILREYVDGINGTIIQTQSSQLK